MLLVSCCMNTEDEYKAGTCLIECPMSLIEPRSPYWYHKATGIPEFLLGLVDLERLLAVSAAPHTAEIRERA